MVRDSFLCVFTMFELHEALLSNLRSTDPCSIKTLVLISISSQGLSNPAVIFFLTFHSLKAYLVVVNADQKQPLPDFKPL